MEAPSNEDAFADGASSRASSPRSRASSPRSRASSPRSALGDGAPSARSPHAKTKRTTTKRGQPGNRTHFSAAFTLPFPRHLVHHVYDDGETKYLRPRRSHVRGTQVPSAYLQQWQGGVKNVERALECFAQPVTALDLSGHISVDAPLLRGVTERLRDSLLSLNLSKCSGYTPDTDGTSMVLSLCSLEHLTTLNLADNAFLLDDDAVDQLVTALHHLTSLDVSGCVFLTDDALTSIARWTSSRLLELGAGRNDNFTEVGTKEVMSQCENLRVLDMSGCGHIRYLALIIELRNGQHIYGSRSLETVTLDGCCGLQEESLDWLCAANAGLTRVSLAEAAGLSEASLMGLAHACPGLVTLNVAGCAAVGGRALRAIADKCHAITELTFARTNNHHIAAADVAEVLSRCPALTKFDVSGNDRVGDDAFAAPAGLPGDAPAPPLPLEWLSVARCGLTGFGLACLAERCTHLRHLDISGLPHVSDEAVSVVVGCCPALRHLWMDDCTALTDRAVVEAAYGLPHLRSLHLSNSNDFTRDSAGDPVEHFQFTDDALEAILDGARHIEEVTFRNQNALKMTAQWFAHGFARRAGHFALRRLDLTGCNHLSLKGMTAVFSQCSDLCEVKISRRLPAASRGRKFWMASFAHATYALSFKDTKHGINVEERLRKNTMTNVSEFFMWEDGRRMANPAHGPGHSTASSMRSPSSRQLSRAPSRHHSPSSSRHNSLAVAASASPSRHNSVLGASLRHHSPSRQSSLLGAAASPSPSRHNSLAGAAIAASPSPSKRGLRLSVSHEVAADFGSPLLSNGAGRTFSPDKQAARGIVAGGAGLTLHSPDGTKHGAAGGLRSHEVAADYGSASLSAPSATASPNKAATTNVGENGKAPSPLADLHAMSVRALELAEGGNAENVDPATGLRVDTGGPPLSPDAGGGARRALVEDHRAARRYSVHRGVDSRRVSTLAATMGLNDPVVDNAAIAASIAHALANALAPPPVQDGPRRKMTAAAVIQMEEAAAETELNLPYVVLRPHPLEAVLRYREKYLRTRMVENRAVRIVQLKFSVYNFWRKMRNKISGRKIAWWYKRILEERKWQIRLKEYIQNTAAKHIQRAYRGHFIVRKRAAILIQKIARGRQGRKFPAIHRRMTAAAIVVQAWVRGWLARLTDRVLLARVYLRLPPFWKDLMHKATCRPGNSLSMALESVRTMLDGTGSRPLGAVPSAFDKDVLRQRAEELRRAAQEADELTADPDAPAPSLLLLDDALPGQVAGGISQVQGDHTTLEDVHEALSSVRDMAYHIDKHVLDPGAPKYVQPLDGRRARQPPPQIVPQGFDKMPYTNNDEGKRYTIVGTKNTLIPEYGTAPRTYKQKAHDKAVALRTGYIDDADAGAEGAIDLVTSDRHPIHFFNMSFWPLPGSIRTASTTEDASTVLFDPHVNSFDLVKKEAEDITLVCEICHAHLQVLRCETCRMGYCFSCGFTAHAKDQRQRHRITMAAPRVVSTTVVGTSLIYHLDIAKQAKHDLRNLVKMLRSAAEVQRIQKDRQAAKEYEEELERQRQEYLKAVEANRAAHQAATRIQCLYRARRAHVRVRETRTFRDLTKATEGMAAIDAACVLIQRRYRGYMARAWMAQRGIVFDHRMVDKVAIAAGEVEKIVKPRGWMDFVSAAELNERIMYDVRQRRVNERTALASTLKDAAVHTLSLLRENIRYWEAQAAALPAEEARLEEVYQRSREKYDAAAQEIPHLRKTLEADAFRLKEAEARALMCPGTGANDRMQNLSSARVWMTNILRTLYRRKSVTETRYEETLARLEWAATESAVLRRTQFHLRERLARLEGKPDTELAADWLSKLLALSDAHQGTLDAQQETTLIFEIDRMRRDAARTLMFDSLMQDLHRALLTDNKLIGERVALEVQSLPLSAGPPCDEAVDISQRLIVVKNKRMMLSGTSEAVVDRMKNAIQEKMTEEDETARNEEYGFPDDSPDFTIAELPKIAVAFGNKYTSMRHSSFQDLTYVYHSQPWLAEEAVRDVRIEDERLASAMEEARLAADLRTLRQNIKTGKDTVKDLEDKMKKLQAEIPHFLTPLPDEDGEPVTEKNEAPEDKQERLAILNALQAELSTKTTEHGINAAVQVRTEAFEPPLLRKIQDQAAKQNRLSIEMLAAAERRDRMSVKFHTLEADFSVHAVELLRKEQVAVAAAIEECGDRRAACLAALDTPAATEVLLQDVLEEAGRLGAEYCDATGLPLPRRYARLRQERQALLHLSRPREEGPAVDLLADALRLRVKELDMEIAALTLVQASLAEEVSELAAYEARKQEYEEMSRGLNEIVMQKRRQKTLQLEFNERSSRLFEARYARIKVLQEAKAKQLNDDEKAEAERLHLIELRKRKKTRFQKLSEAMRKASRRTKDKFVNWRYGINNTMTDQEERMANFIKTRAKASMKGRPQGIAALHITATNAEALLFLAQNEHLKSKGLPYYIKHVMLGGDVWLWAQFSWDNVDFITHLMLNHRDKGHPLHRPEELEKYFEELGEEYEIVQYAGSKAKGAGPVERGLALQIWVARQEGRTKGLLEMVVSASEADEVRFAANEFDRINPQADHEDAHLMNYGVPAAPQTYLWWRHVLKTVGRAIAPEEQSVNELLVECNKIKVLIEEKPDDPTLQDFLHKLQLKLKDAYEREQEYQANKKLETDPLLSTVEFLALTDDELERFMECFRRVDKEGIGRITMDQFFEFIDLKTNPFFESLFTDSAAVDADGFMEFGDFMKVVSMYCMFGLDEILRTLYVYADKRKLGFVTMQQIVDLFFVLNTDHLDRGRMKMGVLSLTIPMEETITFTRFKRLNAELPAVMFACQRLQRDMRAAFLGADWWVKKMLTYERVRKMVGGSRERTQKLIQIELQRFHQDQERLLRMEARRKAIEAEPSALRRAMMSAMQTADEFS